MTTSLNVVSLAPEDNVIDTVIECGFTFSREDNVVDNVTECGFTPE